MTNNTSDNLKLRDLLLAIEQRLSIVSPCEDDLRKAVLPMSEFADQANKMVRLDLFRGAELLTRILELAICWKSQFTDDPQLIDELVGFVRENVDVLKAFVASSETNEATESADAIDTFIGFANEKWGEYLILVEGDNRENEGWDLDPEMDDPWQDPAAHDGDEDRAPSEMGPSEMGPSEMGPSEMGPSETQIELMLSALSSPSASPGSELEPLANSLTASHLLDSAPGAAAPAQPASGASAFDLRADRELMEAYLDDANRCVASMEQAALAIEKSPSDMESVQQFCRELHTLKGASATVGLSELASYLHDLESSLEALFAGDSETVDTESLFVSIDRVREEMNALQSVAPEAESSQQPDSGSLTVSPVRQPDFANLSSNDESSVRIRASKLDRLMDMLAELVVLRNRRESHVAEFNAFNSELATCAARLSLAGEQSEFGGTDNLLASPFSRNTSNTVTEVSKDIAAVSRGMTELQEPVSHDNAAISRFIRDFRQELMQLRRVPVSGLFRRLQRAARDVAKTEGKQVRVEVIGENAGLEQEIQERLFESLMHIVRNSVSHGIEAKEGRIAAGKEPTGVLTLEAFSTAQLLTIEVHDDGNGLNYDAIWKRAISKGLLSPGQKPSEDELARLIFHPGFSTREQASEISGRGVGMDIVAKTIEQLQGRIEVDSTAGQGTTMRLLIPLRTGIEHVMVFRSEGQLFALPMQAVTAAKTTNTSIGNIARLSLSSVSAREETDDTKSQDVLILNGASHARNRNTTHTSQTSESHLALGVDELVGPEEVVVRGLPNLLKKHPLFCGVTLSGSGEKVLLLDRERVEEFCQQHQTQRPGGNQDSQGHGAASNKKRVLVVDDSLTVRRALVKFLQEHDFDTTEAGDGIEAIERLHREQFELVLTDLDMPRLGGLELLSDIQAGRYCDAPVVVVSSRDEETFRMKAMDAGATDYITKPVSKASIAQLLERIPLLIENGEKGKNNE